MLIHPDWPAPPAVRAFVTTRGFGDVSDPETRRKLCALLPAEPAWQKQVHGRAVIESCRAGEADAVVARKPGSVCVVQMADCMPVLFADEAGTTVAAAHAGWRGLAAGVLEATVDAMGVPPQKLVAWLGPAIGPRAYEVGEDVRAVFSSYPNSLVPARPGHWLLDLYAVAREKLKSLKQVSGGGFCTYSEAERFFSYRRDRTSARMAALVWLT
ncbi:MAG: peptidoglycan editing factor PgeF [Burkholderiales bacterium]